MFSSTPKMHSGNFGSSCETERVGSVHEIQVANAGEHLTDPQLFSHPGCTSGMPATLWQKCGVRVLKNNSTKMDQQ